jgi:uncharacterized damage-inducible protein DinB
MPEDAISASFLDYSAKQMESLHNKIATCVGKLTEEQIWQRGGPHENSVGNLLLHLEGNIRQWILHGVDNQPDVRRRDDEFTLAPTTDSKIAFASLTDTINESTEVIATLSPARLTEIIDPQPNGTWRHTPILVAIYKVVSHLDHHTGQIILLTKQMAGTDLDLSMPRKR